MKIDTLEGEDVARHAWCDVRLKSIQWAEGGRDLVLNFYFSEGLIGELKSTWVHSINIELASNTNEGGHPSAFDADSKQSKNGSWKVMLDFASKGRLEFIGSDLVLEK